MLIIAIQYFQLGVGSRCAAPGHKIQIFIAVFWSRALTEHFVFNAFKYLLKIDSTSVVKMFIT